MTNCHGLKMTAHDGKKRLTDVADTEQLLRIIQTIPSPKAEPFKLWLAQVGRKPPPRKFLSRRHRRPFRRTSTWPVPVARWLATHERPLRRRPAFPSSLPRTPHSSAKWLQIYWKMRGIKKMGRFKICLAIDKENRVRTFTVSTRFFIWIPSARFPVPSERSGPAHIYPSPLWPARSNRKTAGR